MIRHTVMNVGPLTLEEIQFQLELAIGRTPSGAKRNEICDANIHIARAIELDHADGGGIDHTGRVAAVPD